MFSLAQLNAQLQENQEGLFAALPLAQLCSYDSTLSGGGSCMAQKAFYFAFLPVWSAFLGMQRFRMISNILIQDQPGYKLDESASNPVFYNCPPT
jgi:hypothetical protein